MDLKSKICASAMSRLKGKMAQNNPFHSKNTRLLWLQAFSFCFSAFWGIMLHAGFTAHRNIWPLDPVSLRLWVCQIDKMLIVLFHILLGPLLLPALWHSLLRPGAQHKRRVLSIFRIAITDFMVLTIFRLSRNTYIPDPILSLIMIMLFSKRPSFSRKTS